MMLVIRGFHSKEQIESFLNTPDSCFDPFLLKDMDLAVGKNPSGAGSIRKNLHLR